MIKKLLLVGAGGFGRVVLEHASLQYNCAFLDDGDASMVDGVPIIGKTADMKIFFPEYKLLLVTIGNNRLRERLYSEAETIGFTFPNIIVPSAYVSPRASIGTGVILLNNVVVQNNAKIRNGCILNPGVEVHHDSTIGNYCLIYTNSVVRSLTQVGDRVWIGSSVTVATSETVPDDTIIEDGAVYKTER